MSAASMRIFAWEGLSSMRKLAIAAFSFSAAIFAANYIFSREGALYAALVCALAGAAVLGVRLKSLRGLVIAAFAAAIGFGVFAVHYDLTVKKAHAIAGETRELSFVLLESPHMYESYTSVEARLDEKGLPRLKCILYDYDGRIGDLSGGDRISAKVKPAAADLRYGVHTDRYNARDVYLTATIKGEIRLTGRRVSFSSLASAAAERIAARAEKVFDGKTAPFVKALLIGDKKDIYDDDALYVSLSRAGLMHVVAVSGMHVSYLVAFLQFLLGRGKRSSLLCILLVWAFVAVSGMSPAAARAAFMQTMLLSAPLFERENDPITSLAAALAFLLLCNPFAAAGISLQLSFAAMLGIVLLAERIQELLMPSVEKGPAKKLLKVFVGIVSCSLSVMVFTLPITAAYFGYVAVLSPLTNLLCLWAVPFCFAGAIAACALSWVPLLGKLLVFLVSLLVRYFLLVCRQISSIGFCAVYLTGWVSSAWIVLFYLSVAAVFLLKLKPRLRLIIPLATAIVALLVSHAALSLYYSSAKGTVTAIDVGQGQCIAVMSGKNAVLIDCGSTSYADYNAGDSAAAYLKSSGIDRLDAVIFTHLHEDHANGYERLANLIEIEKVIIPTDVDNEDRLLWDIVSCAVAHGTDVKRASGDEMERYGEIRLLLLSTEGQGEENERCMPVIASVGEYDVIITGDAPASREKELVRRADLSGIEALVVGHHGSKSSSCEEYLSAVSGKTAIISVGKNSYGLPAPEVLERLGSLRYTVFRTDKDGSVEIRIDG